MTRPQLEIVESVVTPNAPFLLDDIVIGTTARRPEGDGWILVEYLIHQKATRWVRRRPARLPKEESDA